MAEITPVTLEPIRWRPEPGSYEDILAAKRLVDEASGAPELQFEHTKAYLGLIVAKANLLVPGRGPISSPKEAQTEQKGNCNAFSMMSSGFMSASGIESSLHLDGDHFWNSTVIGDRVWYVDSHYSFIKPSGVASLFPLNPDDKLPHDGDDYPVEGLSNVLTLEERRDPNVVWRLDQPDFCERFPKPAKVTQVTIKNAVESYVEEPYDLGAVEFVFGHNTAGTFISNLGKAVREKQKQTSAKVQALIHSTNLG